MEKEEKEERSLLAKVHNCLPFQQLVSDAAPAALHTPALLVGQIEISTAGAGGTHFCASKSASSGETSTAYLPEN